MSQVSENGAVSFDREWLFDKPEPFPTNSRTVQNRYVVAPFWSDNDIRRAGTVRYVLIENGTSITGDELLETANAFIQREHQVNFTGKVMLVAQWDHVHPYPHGSPGADSQDESLNKVNSHNNIIITFALTKL